MTMINFKQTANFIWEIANLLCGDYKQSDYGKVILPLTYSGGWIVFCPLQSKRYWITCQSSKVRMSRTSIRF